MLFKKIILLSLLISVFKSTQAQYFQQEVVYKIDAKLDTVDHVITATTDITYTNKAPKALDTFFIHLWANAFSDKLSAFSDQSIRMGKLEHYFSKEKNLGGYSNLEVRLEGKKMTLYSWKKHSDVVYFLLPKAIKTDENIVLNTSYTLALPKFWSRMGRRQFDDFLMYWYPSPAVYDSEGWHPMPYLNMGEFYSEFADFKIQITNPFPHVTASKPPLQKEGNTYTYKASSIHDFAIVGSKNKATYTHSFSTKNGQNITLNIMTRYPERKDSIQKYITNSIDYFESLIGPFPYDYLSIVDKGKKSSSGMEYPGLITVSGEADESGNLEYYVIHELLHQWFYGSLAFNQRDHAWLDEGLTTYYQQRYFKELLGKDHYSSNLTFAINKGQAPVLQTLARGQGRRCYHHHLDASASDPTNYGLNAYEIPARLYAYIANYLSQDVFDKAMKDFYKKHRDSHPMPDDFKTALESASNKNLDWFFNGMVKEGWAYDYKLDKGDALIVQHISGATPPYKITFQNKNGNVKDVWIEGHVGSKKIDFPAGEWTSAALDFERISMDINADNNYWNVKRPIKFVPIAKLDDARYKEIYFTPTISYNSSDGGQIGIALYNSGFPSKRLRWALSPAYGFRSKKFVGEGWVNYDQYLKNDNFRKLQYRLNMKSYDFRYSEGLDASLRFTRVSPHISLHFNHDANRYIYSKAYLKSVILNEEYFQFEEENFSIKNRNSALYRLGYEYYDFWSLGPSDLKVEVEYYPYKNALGEQHDYTKLTAAYNKSFNFAPERSIDFRLWGSYFITNTQRESSNYDGTFAKGSLALIHQGFNDYAYDDYYFNRANQGVALDNQISYLGGAFKTPFGSQYAVGQSNDFAFAINMKSDLPVKLPKLLPLKLFLDVGYYRSKATVESPLKGQNLYSGGVMLEYGEGMFAIYLPLFQNDVLSEIYEIEGISTFGKVSFKIDLIRMNPWDILEDFEF